MRLRPPDLARQLSERLLPLYLISGDEPLQAGECADAVRQAARAAGYANREILEVGGQFDWRSLGAEASALSLFSERKLIDLRIPKGKLGKEGGRALVDYCAAPPPDTLLLITLPKLDKAQWKTKWAQAVDKLGATVQIWPIEGRQLLQWLNQRLRAAGLQPGPGVLDLLLEHTEGNLLAARQEIEKLRLLHGAGRIDSDGLAEAISDSSRFDVFDLVDSALAGDAPKALKTLHSLQAEGLAAPVVLWALSRECRQLTSLAAQTARGLSADRAMQQARVWDKRKPLIGGALRRLSPNRLQSMMLQCAHIDATIKGARQGSAWLALEDLTLQLAGTPVLQAAPH